MHTQRFVIRCAGDLGRTVSQARHLKGVSKTDLAAQTGIPRDYLSRLEGGTATFTSSEHSHHCVRWVCDSKRPLTTKPISMAKPRLAVWMYGARVAQIEQRKGNSLRLRHTSEALER